MKKVLEKMVVLELFHYVNNKREEGPNPDMSGDCTWLSGDCMWLSGDCTGLSGNCTCLSGDCTGLLGDCTGLSGNCTGLSGNLDDARLTAKERENGVAITDLIKDECSGVR